MSYATRSTPAGCLLSLLSVLPFVFSGLLLWIAWRIYATVESVTETREAIVWLICGALLSLGGGIALLALGIRSLKRASLSDYDATDPDEPRVKW